MPPETTCIFCLYSVQPGTKNVRTRSLFKDRKVDNGFSSALLDNELNVMFIVRKLLSIPEQQCTDFLEKFGNPTSWLIACRKCSEIVNEAREIHKKIIALEKRLDSKRKEVKLKIIESVERKVSFKRTRSNEGSLANPTSTLIRNTVLSNELKVSSDDKQDVEIKDEPAEYNNLEDNDNTQDSFCISDDGTESELSDPTELECDPHGSYSRATTTGDNKASLFKRSTEVSRKRSRKSRSSRINDSKRRKIGSYKCSHCSFVSKLPGELRGHLKRIHWVSTNHTKKNKDLSNRRCPSCNKIFHELETFRKHCIDDHSMLSCNLCPRLFPSYRNLRKHHRRTHDDNKRNNLSILPVPINKASGTSEVGESEVYKCPYCNFYSIRKYKTFNHIREVHWEVYAQMRSQHSHSESTPNRNPNQKTLQCDKCPMDGSEENQFCSLDDLNQHKVTAHKMGQCKECSRVFLGMGYLDNHQKKYHSAENEAKLLAETTKVRKPKKYIEQKPPTCKYCEETFETKSQLTQHHFETHPNEMYNCEKCSEKFETMANLYFHKTVVHNESDNPYKCPLCNYSNRRFRQVHEHRMKMHEERIRFVCETCGDSFSDARYLKLHKICKHGVKSDINLKCNACGKMFSTTTYLQRHMNTVHLGQWRYKCPQCDTGFMSQKQVDHHVNAVHDRILLHECTVEGCEKKYAANYQLKQHVRRVHGPKSFKCSYCDYACSDARQMRIHEEEVHVKSGSFQCDYCGKSYNIRRCLKQHLRMTHKIRLGRGKQAKLTDFVAQTLEDEAKNTSRHDCISNSTETKQ